MFVLCTLFYKSLLGIRVNRKGITGEAKSDQVFHDIEGARTGLSTDPNKGHTFRTHNFLQNLPYSLLFPSAAGLLKP